MDWPTRRNFSSGSSGTIFPLTGMDKEHGGVYTCLDRKGEIYSTDKSVWMQGAMQ